MSTAICLRKTFPGCSANTRSSGTKITERTDSEAVSRKSSTRSLGTWSNIKAAGAEFQRPEQRGRSGRSRTRTEAVAAKQQAAREGGLSIFRGAPRSTDRDRVPPTVRPETRITKASEAESHHRPGRKLRDGLRRAHAVKQRERRQGAVRCAGRHERQDLGRAGWREGERGRRPAG